MANISEALKHPILLVLIPAALGLAGTLYSSADKNKAASTQTEKSISEAEKVFWASIQPPNESEEQYCAYLEQYPKGEFVKLALPKCSAALEAKQAAEEQATELAQQKAEAQAAAKEAAEAAAEAAKEAAQQ